MRMYLINAENRTITEAEYTGLESLQKAVGGYIEIAHEFKNHDTVFVNEEGLYQGYQFGFSVQGAYHPFLGNGVVAGLDPRTGDTAEVKSSLQEIQSKIKFLSLDEIRKSVGAKAKYKKTILAKSKKSI